MFYFAFISGVGVHFFFFLFGGLGLEGQISTEVFFVLVFVVVVVFSFYLFFVFFCCFPP